MNYSYRHFRVILSFASFLVLLSCAKPLHPSIDVDSRATNYVKVEKEDEEISSLIAPYKKKLDVQMNQVIGYCEKLLDKGESQSTLGNFIIDLTLLKSEQYYEKPIDFALVTTGGLRTPLPAGNITVGNIYELMPFENELVVVTLNGSTVQKLLNHAVAVKNTQFAGLKYETDGITCQNVMISGQPFDSTKSYTMAVSDYLANGGDHLDFLTEATDFYQLGKTFRDAILEHINDLTAAKKNIDGNIDDRVVVKDKL